MGPGSKRIRAGTVALAACLLAFGPATAAFALAPEGVSTRSHPGEPGETVAPGPQTHSNGVGPKFHPFEPSAAGGENFDVTYQFFIDDQGEDDGSSPEGETGGSGGEPSEEDDQGRAGVPSGGNGGVPPGQVPLTTTTTIPVPTTTQPPAPTTTTSTVTTPVLPATSTTTTAPQPSTTPAITDDDSSSDDPVTKTSGSVSKPPADVEPNKPAPLASVEADVSETTSSSDATVRSRAAVDWTFLTGETEFVAAQVEQIETPEPASNPSMVVLSWLVERDSMSPSMAMLSPVVVLLTIWDAAASAGSGLAAPASGLGTLVLLVLFEKGHLANGARLFRRRLEA